MPLNPGVISSPILRLIWTRITLVLHQFSNMSSEVLKLIYGESPKYSSRRRALRYWTPYPYFMHQPQITWLQEEARRLPSRLPPCFQLPPRSDAVLEKALYIPVRVLSRLPVNRRPVTVTFICGTNFPPSVLLIVSRWLPLQWH